MAIKPIIEVKIKYLAKLALAGSVPDNIYKIPAAIIIIKPMAKPILRKYVLTAPKQILPLTHLSLLAGDVVPGSVGVVVSALTIVTDAKIAIIPTENNIILNIFRAIISAMSFPRKWESKFWIPDLVGDDK